MAAEDGLLRRIEWLEAFPFLRLFRTVGMALSFKSLGLSFVAVFLVYLAGRILDVMWVAAGAGVLVDPTPLAARQRTEIETYTVQSSAEWQNWRRGAITAREAFAKNDDAKFRDDIKAVIALVNSSHESDLAAIDSDKEKNAAEKAAARENLQREYEEAMAQLTGREPVSFGAGRRPVIPGTSTLLDVVKKVVHSAPRTQSKPAVEPLVEYQKTLLNAGNILNARRAAPRGVFAALLAYETDCFAAAVRGVAGGRFFFAGGVYDPEPSMLGSVASAGGGLLWFVTQRPWYFIFFGAFSLIVAALFGTAVCRSAAILWAREETVAIGKLLAFSMEKFVDLVCAPLLPLAIFVVVWIVLALAGLVGAIPVVGTFLSGLMFFVALIGGAALVFCLIGIVFGMHLMWPTIAVEGSDVFDAVQRAASYVFQRAWHVAFYTISLLIYGGFAFLALRGLALVLLKCSHAAVDAGMSGFGFWHSSSAPSMTKLQTMWTMPSWQDLPILPTVGDNNFWGRFGLVELSGSEWLASGLISFWVFLVVALVGAFVVSFFFTGSTNMYLLLRRSVDGIELDEIYFEEFDDASLDPAPEPLPAPEAASSATKGTALPVVGGGKA